MLHFLVVTNRKVKDIFARRDYMKINNIDKFIQSGDYLRIWVNPLIDEQSIDNIRGNMYSAIWVEKPISEKTESILRCKCNNRILFKRIMHMPTFNFINNNSE